MATNWNEYQEESAAFFRNLGLNATTNVRLSGARTHHNVDVVVLSQHLGFDIMWIVECKYWQTPVSKLHVLALREIVADTGADRGILLCEAGFQSGALEAANLTNVQATSLAECRNRASADIFAMRLRDLNERTLTCKQRYWDIPKEERIRAGLRFDVPIELDPSGGQSLGYSGARAVEFAEEIVAKALRGTYPFECDGIGALAYMTPSRQLPRFASPHEVLTVLETVVVELERRLELAQDGVEQARPRGQS